MTDRHSLSSDTTDVFGPLPGGERVMWRGHCGVAEYAFEEAASLPRWTLPEATEVLVTDQRVRYAYQADDQVHTGELRWLWPQHLRVQPGARSTDRGAATTQVQIVCGGTDGGWPALVFAGGELRTVADADRLANTLRQAIARFRVDHADKLGLNPSQTRMLAKLLMAPEFRNHQGGKGQTVSLLGALPVPTAATGAHAAVEPCDEPAADGSESATAAGARPAARRPGMAADAARALLAAQAEQAVHESEPDLASRAAAVAARVAELVSRSAVEEPPAGLPEQTRTVNLTEPAEPEQTPTVNLTERAEAVRRTAVRMAANSAGTRAAARRPDREPGVTNRKR